MYQHFIHNSNTVKKNFLYAPVALITCKSEGISLLPRGGNFFFFYFSLTGKVLESDSWNR